MLHEDHIRVMLKMDGVVRGGLVQREYPLTTSSAGGRHMRCLIPGQSGLLEADHAIVRLQFRDKFQLHGASTLRILVEVEDAVGKPGIASSYLCSISEKLEVLVIRTLKGDRVKPYFLPYGIINFQFGYRRVCVSISRGLICSPDSATSAPGPSRPAAPAPPKSSSFVPLQGQHGEPYRFEFCSESQGALLAMPGRGHADDVLIQEWKGYRATLVARLGEAEFERKRSVQERTWRQLRGAAAIADGRVIDESNPNAPSTDIVMIDSEEGREPPVTGQANGPPATCDCPADHTRAASIRAAKSRKTRIRFSARKTPAKSTEASPPKPTQAAGDDEELTSTTCTNCKKVKAPPRGKKLGLRSNGKHKVIKYIPLDADDGFGTSNGSTNNATGTAKNTESQMTARRDPVHAIPQTTVPAIPEVHPDTSSAVADSLGEDQSLTEEAPITMHDSSKRAAEVPNPAKSPATDPASSPQESRKRSGDAQLEEPLSKKQNVDPSSTGRDEDDEEPDMPIPVVKLEPNEIIVIEDDDDEAVELRGLLTKHTGRVGAKQMELQHKLQLLEIEREEQRVAKEALRVEKEMERKEQRVAKEALRVEKEALQIKHELAVLEQSENIKKETPIKIED